MALEIRLRVVAVLRTLGQQAVRQLHVPVLERLRAHQTTSKLHPCTTPQYTTLTQRTKSTVAIISKP